MHRYAFSLLREPLTLFVLLSLALFALYARVGPADGRDARRIAVSAAQVDALAAGFARTWQRAPTAPELEQLVEEHVRDEIFAREARALGLEQDDVIVRRRLRNQMEMLLASGGDAAVPGDAELQRYLEAHADAFRVEPRAALRQVYLSRERRGAAADDAQRLLAALRTDGAPRALDALGDPTLLRAEIPLSSRSELARELGEAFADAVLAADVGRWSGPIESSFGVHLVLVSERQPARLPSLEEVRPAVAREWQADRSRARIEAAYAALRGRYEIAVEPVARSW